MKSRCVIKWSCAVATFGVRNFWIIISSITELFIWGDKIKKSLLIRTLCSRNDFIFRFRHPKKLWTPSHLITFQVSSLSRYHWMWRIIVPWLVTFLRIPENKRRQRSPGTRPRTTNSTGWRIIRKPVAWSLAFYTRRDRALLSLSGPSPRPPSTRV